MRGQESKLMILECLFAFQIDFLNSLSQWLEKQFENQETTFNEKVCSVSNRKGFLHLS